MWWRGTNMEGVYSVYARIGGSKARRGLIGVEILRFR
jgi:hypothetical protein